MQNDKRPEKIDARWLRKEIYSIFVRVNSAIITIQKLAIPNLTFDLN